MKQEIQSLEDNDTWEVVTRPSQVKFLHTKWVFKTKTNADGSIERRKGRLVACGNEQIFGVNYTATFSAVMDNVSSKFVIAMGALWEVPAVHWDVPNAYVKAQKEEDLDIFLEVPKGFNLQAQPGFEETHPSEAALRLKKSLYGL